MALLKVREVLGNDAELLIDTDTNQLSVGSPEATIGLGGLPSAKHRAVLFLTQASTDNPTYRGYGDITFGNFTRADVGVYNLAGGFCQFTTDVVVNIGIDSGLVAGQVVAIVSDDSQIQIQTFDTDGTTAKDAVLTSLPIEILLMQDPQ